MNLKDNQSTEQIKLSNDLTKTEREQEKMLFEKTKELNKEYSGEFQFRVKGPPWARRIAKFPIGTGSGEEGEGKQ